MKYVVNKSVRSRRGAGKGLWDTVIEMGIIFSDIEIENKWVSFIALNKRGKYTKLWIPLYACTPIPENYSHPAPPPLPANQLRLRYHSQLADPSKANIGSFGIAPFRGDPKGGKPHSIILNELWVQLIRDLQTQEFYDAVAQYYPCDNPDIRLEAGQKVDPEAAWQWMFEHEDTKNYGANLSGNLYSIPAQGCVGGNIVGYDKEDKGHFRILGLSGMIPPRVEDLIGRPDLVHFFWCPGRGKTIRPPCFSAFIPVINPIGMRGATMSRWKNQTEIWLNNMWRWE